MDKKKIMLPVFFIVIVFAPITLGFLSQAIQKNMDVSLNGYYDSYEKPLFTFRGFTEGSFQTEFENWLNNNLVPRGIYIKSYNQLQYSLFNLNNKVVVGRNGNLFEEDEQAHHYISSELAYASQGLDYSADSKKQEMQEYVDLLAQLSDKLEKVGKHLLVYTTPNKAHYFREDIPKRYLLQPQGQVRAIDCFRELIRGTSVNYLDTEYLLDDSVYPTFYTTGTHWSRPVEQEASIAVMDALKKISGKNLRNLVLDDIEMGTVPYGRDSDIYDLMNVFAVSQKDVYYQYRVSFETPEKYDKTRMLLQGGSFAEGLYYYDYFGEYNNETAYYINYNVYLADKNGIMPIAEWTDVDFAAILDDVDFVVIELNEMVASNYSNGFVHYLNSYMDHYVPGDKKDAVSLPEKLDPANLEGLAGGKGLYWYEGDHVWSKRNGSVALDNPYIAERGLEIVFHVDEHLLTDGKDNICIYVNQKRIRSLTLDTAGIQSVYIAGEELDCADGTYFEVEFVCEKAFNPYEIGISEDNRELALDLMYVGDKR